MYAPRPVFKPHHNAVPDGVVPYISCSDLFDYKFNVKIIPFAEFIWGDNDNVDHSTDTPIYTMLKTAISILLFYFFADIWRQIEKDETIYSAKGYYS